MNEQELQAAYDEWVMRNGGKDGPSDLGWSFLYSPKRMIQTAPIALSGLNPGGNVRSPSSWDYDEPGGFNAFLDQPWGDGGQFNSLQVQLRRLFELLGVEHRQVLGLNLVPFRSPDWESLPKKEAEFMMEVGRRLWAANVVSKSPARLYIIMGTTQAEREIPARFNAQLEGRWNDIRSPELRACSWGEFEAPDGRRILAIPHLSQFPLLRDEASRDASSGLLHRLRDLAGGALGGKY